MEKKQRWEVHEAAWIKRKKTTKAFCKNEWVDIKQLYPVKNHCTWICFWQISDGKKIRDDSIHGTQTALN